MIKSKSFIALLKCFLLPQSEIFLVVDGRPSGAILILGYYDHDLEWPKPDLNSGDDVINPETTLRHHKQFYANGTKCDLTGEHRKTEVRVCIIIITKIEAKISTSDE